MRDVVRYVNSAGDEQVFSKGGCFCNTKALREFLYTVNNKRFYGNQPKTVVLEIVISGPPAERDMIIDLLEYDVIKETYGRLYVNDWYLICRFVGVQSISREGWNNVRVNLQFMADTIQWNCDVEKVLVIADEESNDADYPLGYPSNYSVLAGFENDEAGPADFVLETLLTAEMITAHTVAYTITDGAGNTHTYSVDLSDYTVSVGDAFVLDTQAKAVGVYHNNSYISVFGGASDVSYIFEQIEAGEARVSSSYEGGIRFTMVKHRRLPKWEH